MAVGSVTWSKEGAELSRGAEGLRRRLLRETELERLTAAWTDFVPLGFGDQLVLAVLVKGWHCQKRV